MIGEPAAPAVEVVVVVTSLGGTRALLDVVPSLPAAFPVPIVVQMHRAPAPEDHLVALLQARSDIPVGSAAPGVLAPGVHLVPPAASATLTAPGQLAIGGHGLRPGDDLLRSAAMAHRTGVLALVMTGRLDDGARGTVAVKRAGGVVVVEDPSTAAAPDMPRAALATGCVDLALPRQRLGAALVAYAMAPGARALLRTAPPPPWATVATA